MGGIVDTTITISDIKLTGREIKALFQRISYVS